MYNTSLFRMIQFRLPQLHIPNPSITNLNSHTLSHNIPFSKTNYSNWNNNPITKRIVEPDSERTSWSWRLEEDLKLNGAFFVESLLVSISTIPINEKFVSPIEFPDK